MERAIYSEGPDCATSHRGHRETRVAALEIGSQEVTSRSTEMRSDSPRDRAISDPFGETREEGLRQPHESTLDVGKAAQPAALRCPGAAPGYSAARSRVRVGAGRRRFGGLTRAGLYLYNTNYVSCN